MLRKRTLLDYIWYHLKLFFFIVILNYFLWGSKQIRFGLIRKNPFVDVMQLWLHMTLRIRDNSIHFLLLRNQILLEFILWQLLLRFYLIDIFIRSTIILYITIKYIYIFSFLWTLWKKLFHYISCIYFLL